MCNVKNSWLGPCYTVEEIKRISELNAQMFQAREELNSIDKAATLRLIKKTASNYVSVTIDGEEHRLNVSE